MDDERIIQIEVNPLDSGTNQSIYLALTNKGRLFKRTALVDKPNSQWEPVDLPIFELREKEREFKLEVQIDEIKQEK